MTFRTLYRKNRKGLCQIIKKKNNKKNNKQNKEKNLKPHNLEGSRFEQNMKKEQKL